MYMKLSILISLVLLCVGKLKAQTTHGVVPDGTKMGILENKSWAVTSFEQTDDDALKGNSLLVEISSEDATAEIDGKTYTVARTPYVDENGDIAFQKYYFQEDGGIVYRYDPKERKSFAVFNFNLSEGDVFNSPTGERMEVVRVERSDKYPFYDYNSGGDRKMLMLRGIDNNTKEDVWIEGVGSAYTGILSQSEFRDSEAYLNFMFHMRISGEHRNEQVFFPYNLGCYKTTFVFCPQAMEDEKDTEYFLDYYQGNRLFDIDFLNDTLHIVGFAAMYGPICEVSTVINGNVIDLSFASVYPYSGTSYTYYKVDAKIPGFNSGTYLIRHNIIRPAEQTAVCRTSVMESIADVNSDGHIDISDIVEIINVIANTSSNEKADVNNDGKVDVSDIVDIIHVISGKE